MSWILRPVTQKIKSNASSAVVSLFASIGHGCSKTRQQQQTKQEPQEPQICCNCNCCRTRHLQYDHDSSFGSFYNNNYRNCNHHQHNYVVIPTTITTTTIITSPSRMGRFIIGGPKNDATRLCALVQDHGISPLHANHVGQLALHVAALWGHVEFCQALVDLGANVHAANALSGATPLHMVVQPPHKASLAQQEQVVDHLLAARADPTVPDHFGELPVDYVLQQFTAKNATPQQAASLSSSSLSSSLLSSSSSLSLSSSLSSSSSVQKLQIAAPPLWTYIQQGQVAEVQLELQMHPEACHKVVRNQTAGTIAFEAFLQQCQEEYNNAKKCHPCRRCHLHHLEID